MKVTLSFIAGFVAALQVSASVVAPNARSVDLESSEQTYCGYPKTAVPLLRAWNAAQIDHFYTTDVAEMQRALTNGYASEGVTGYVFSTQQPKTIPLYRLWNGPAADHFYTTSAEERDRAIASLGYTSEGITGFVYPDNSCRGYPLYRSFRSSGTDHFYTMSAAERDNAEAGGWAYEGIAAYILPA